MGLADTYRSNVLRKQKEIADLSERKAREQKSLATIYSRIENCSRSLNSTKQLSMIKSKQAEISRYKSQQVSIERKIAELEGKIAKLNISLANEQKKLANEEGRELKKNIEDQKRIAKQHKNEYQSINKVLNTHEIQLKKLEDVPEKIIVLFLASNPKDQASLSLDEEVREIQKNINSSKHRDSVKLESCWAVRPMDILYGLNQHKPTIVHFSGHGSKEDELVLMDDLQNTKLVSLPAIVQTMNASVDGIKLVFFNTCHSFNQAKQIVQYVDAAIGMKSTISDAAAKVFSSQFYSSIGFGLSVQKSFDQAKALIMMEGINEENVPELYIKEGVSSNDLIIVKPSGI